MVETRVRKTYVYENEKVSEKKQIQGWRRAYFYLTFIYYLRVPKDADAIDLNIAN